MSESDLDEILIVDAFHEVHRIAGEPRRDILDEENTHENVGGYSPEEMIELLIKAAFEPQEWRPQRFTQEGGEIAFYAALEHKTACEEVAFHFKTRFGYLDRVREGAPVRFVHFVCNFKGKITDICGLANRLPDLLADTPNEMCCRIARRARNAGADGLLSPSVRNRPDGRCVTVFKREALSPSRIEQTVLFFLISPTHAVQYKFQPYEERPSEF